MPASSKSETPWTVIKEFKRDDIMVRVERMNVTPPRYSFIVGSHNGYRFVPHVYPKHGDRFSIGWKVAGLVDEACAFIEQEREKHR